MVGAASDRTDEANDMGVSGLLRVHWGDREGRGRFPHHPATLASLPYALQFPGCALTLRHFPPTLDKSSPAHSHRATGGA